MVGGVQGRVHHLSSMARGLVASLRHSCGVMPRSDSTSANRLVALEVRFVATEVCMQGQEEERTYQYERMVVILDCTDVAQECANFAMNIPLSRLSLRPPMLVHVWISNPK